MSFSDHKITQFTHKITDLPDQPSLPANELKARFDSSPEELRESVNGICDDADRLEERVSGIIAETFGDTITEDMLSEELDATLARRSDLYYGFYTGDGVYPRTITLGFTPKMVYVVRASGQAISTSYICACLVLPETNEEENNIPAKIVDGGFALYQTVGERSYLNREGEKMCYIAVK